MLPVLFKKSKIEVDCNSVRTFVLVKSAGAVSQWYGHLRVSGIPIPKTLVIWASPVTLILTQIAKVIWEGYAPITRGLGMGMPESRLSPVSLFFHPDAPGRLFNRCYSDTGIPAKFFSLTPHGHVRLARFARECHAGSSANQFLGKQGAVLRFNIKDVDT